MAYPTDPLTVVIEFWDGTQWVDITSDVYARGKFITIRRGFPDEGSSPEPSSCSMELRNVKYQADGVTVDWAGRYSPRNPTSIYYGLIGRNTPVRVTVNESFVASGDQIRYAGEISEWPSRWDVSGKDAWVDVTAQGILRRLGQGSAPLRSPLKSGILDSPAAAFVVDYWPMEDAAGATSFASALPARPPLVVTGTAPDAASIGPLLGSDKIPVLGSTTALSAAVATYTDVAPQDFGVRAILDVPASPSWSDNTPILWLYQLDTTGVDRYEIRYKSATGFLGIRALDAAGAAVNGETTSSVDIRGRQIYLGMALLASGGNTAVTGFYKYDDGTGTLTEHSWNTGAIATSVLTRATRVTVAPTGGLAELAIGQLIVTTGFLQFESGWFSGSEVEDGLISYAGEAAGRRAARLADERDVTFTGIYTDDEDETALMGAQTTPSSFADAYNETWAADLALAYETRDDLGLSFRSRHSLYNQAVGLELDYEGAGEIAGLEPTDDDRYIRNDITVKRKNGSSARAVDDTSPLGTEDPPDGVGRYDVEVEVNLFADTQCEPQAYWRLHVGTWDEQRYPTVIIDMAALAAAGKTSLMADVAALDVGDRVLLVNLPDWLPPFDADLMVLGFQETIGHPNDWTVTLTCVPYGPYDVGTLASDTDAGRLDTRGCTTAEALDTTETGVDVTNSDGGWSDTAEPYDIEIGGERMTVTSAGTPGTSQTLTVTRSVNGVVKSHSIGAGVTLVDPLRLVL